MDWQNILEANLFKQMASPIWLVCSKRTSLAGKGALGRMSD